MRSTIDSMRSIRRSGSPPWNSIFMCRAGERNATSMARVAVSGDMSNRLFAGVATGDLAVCTRVLAAERHHEDVEARELAEHSMARVGLHREQVQGQRLFRSAEEVLPAKATHPVRIVEPEVHELVELIGGKHQVLTDHVRHEDLVAVEAVKAEGEQLERREFGREREPDRCAVHEAGGSSSKPSCENARARTALQTGAVSARIRSLST